MKIFPINCVNLDRFKLQFVDRKAVINDLADSQHLAHLDSERGYKSSK